MTPTSPSKHVSQITRTAFFHYHTNINCLCPSPSSLLCCWNSDPCLHHIMNWRLPHNYTLFHLKPWINSSTYRTLLLAWSPSPAPVTTSSTSTLPPVAPLLWCRPPGISTRAGVTALSRWLQFKFMVNSDKRVQAHRDPDVYYHCETHRQWRQDLFQQHKAFWEPLKSHKIQCRSWQSANLNLAPQVQISCLRKPLSNILGGKAQQTLSQYQIKAHDSALWKYDLY